MAEDIHHSQRRKRSERTTLQSPHIKKQTHPISVCGGSLADEGEVSIDKTEKPYINPDFTSGRSLPACTYFDDKSAPLDITGRAQ